MLAFACAPDDPPYAELEARLGQALKRVDLADDDTDVVDAFAACVAAGARAVGGFSRGARLAARFCAGRSDVDAFVACGFPFHPPGAPAARAGLATFLHVPTPTVLVQGTRDSHGSEADVRGYGLPPRVEVVWMADGNHRFVPRARGAHDEGALRAQAADAIVAFLRRTGTPPA
jgi:hypothetical protein